MGRNRTAKQRAAHAAQSRARRRRKANDVGTPLGSGGRSLLLRLVRRGHSIGEVAERRGVSMAAIWERAQMFPAWGRALDRALMLGRDPGIAHGSEWSYRKHGCRCPECREAKRRYR